MITLVTRSAEETRALGVRIGAQLAAGDVVGLIGPLGAGKTVMAQGIAAGAGVPPGEYVASPTYALVNLYRGRVRVVHADWYRIASAEELYAVGFADLYEDSAVVIEWMDRVPEAAPAERLEVLLEGSGDERRIALRPSGARYQRMVEKLAAP